MIKQTDLETIIQFFRCKNSHHIRELAMEDPTTLANLMIVVSHAETALKTFFERRVREIRSGWPLVGQKRTLFRNAFLEGYIDDR